MPMVLFGAPRMPAEVRYRVGMVPVRRRVPYLCLEGVHILQKIRG